MDISQIVTKADIEKLKEEIFAELNRIRFHGQKVSVNKQWLKSYEVCQLLSISKGTLSTYRRNGIIRFTRIGGLMYYSYQDISLLLSNK
ncbi:helix-turn-helix domain-containing protein [Pedobacter frigidisoli]|uniref:helix-turn-helix domain-containing protein n=1 Tax=Pedobacter frigidisoli TaxID=2530455 RepID=UPI00292E7B97|nr:helix-turn-helix domain-containing protein [Pedobacter frigidisoli]